MQELPWQSEKKKDFKKMIILLNIDVNVFIEIDCDEPCFSWPGSLRVSKSNNQWLFTTLKKVIG